MVYRVLNENFELLCILNDLNVTDTKVKFIIRFEDALENDKY